MIKPNDLLSLADRLAALQSADRLAAVQHEPEGRAAVSRAYYSAFHVAKSLIEEGCGVVLPVGPEAHEKLYRCLANSNSNEVAEIGDRLKSLRAERNLADYRLTDSKFAIAKNVQMQITLAKSLVADLTTAESRIAEFRTSVQSYASGTLKLTLRAKQSG